MGEEEPRIGVFICHCGLNIAGVIDVERVREAVSALPGVVVCEDYPYMCSEPGQELIIKRAKELSLDRLVVASCSPAMHEPTFRDVARRAGLNPYMLEMANIREHCSWCHSHEPEKATEKAIELVAMAVAKARLLEPLEARKAPVECSAVVIGGGIAGITAALDLADAGVHVYLVERSPSIGGHMAQLDKTFPTLDCSACILTPKMVSVARHPNVELLTYSEVIEARRVETGFNVKVLKKARYVDEARCTGCGACTEHCPIEVPSEFDACLGPRRAIYIPFPQAVPKVALIDRDHCIMCGLCRLVCEAGAIDFNQKDEELEIRAGAMVIATGMGLLDVKKLPEFAAIRSPNLVTHLQLERLLSSSGPTGGRVLRPSDGKEPRSVVIITCVGSRDERANPYCCRIGCSVAIKQAFLLKERLGPETEVFICFTDMRAYGRGLEEFYARAREEGVRFIRGSPSDMDALPDGSIRLAVFDQSTGKLLEIKADLVVLVVGLTPPEGFKDLASQLKISLGPDGFALEAHPKLRPAETPAKGMFLAGACQGPKDIVETTAHASAAAMKAAAMLLKGYVLVEPFVASVDEERCRGCGRCEEVCEFGAIGLEERDGRLVAKVNDVLCEGCGACTVRCPTGAVRVHGFTREQILAQVEVAAGVRG
ncbi:MAG TPA: CoB--CoM heterodisulfide reductase iron-sulfur subunit A family protein [Candidatus Bathyarchaeota archaeon]|nr:CoB--CoM heterodisulfide reductase iron-sulfur subunit A family protein [Candidatus Bathyarchaeota archaeon]